MVQGVGGSNLTPLSKGWEGICPVSFLFVLFGFGGFFFFLNVECFHDFDCNLLVANSKTRGSLNQNSLILAIREPGL